MWPEVPESSFLVKTLVFLSSSHHLRVLNHRVKERKEQKPGQTWGQIRKHGCQDQGAQPGARPSHELHVPCTRTLKLAGAAAAKEASRKRCSWPPGPRGKERPPLKLLPHYLGACLAPVAPRTTRLGSQLSGSLLPRR